MPEDEIASKPEATLRQGGKEIHLTLAEAKLMRAALLESLRTSVLGDRATLLARTEPLPAWIDADDRVLLGGWLLQLRAGELVAAYQLSRNEERAVGYAATFVKEGTGWQVKAIVPENISFRR